MDRSQAEKIIVALDITNWEEAVKIVHTLRPWVKIFKLGAGTLLSLGIRIIELIRQNGAEVFLDLKFHDIPSTVARAAVEAAKREVFMLTLHTGGGYQMMSKTMAALKVVTTEAGLRMPLVLGVTILTSLTEKVLHDELGIAHPLTTQVVRLAQLAQRAGLPGIVASPQEIAPIRRCCGKDLLLVTPGIRPTWYSQSDQKRHLTPRQALQEGADYLVIGRPIINAPDPKEALLKILDEFD